MSFRRRVKFGALDVVGCEYSRTVFVRTVFLCFLASFSFVHADHRPIGICANSACNCTTKAHHWIKIKCVFSSDQDVDLAKGAIPIDAREVEISHCRELRIQSGAFTSRTPIRHVHMKGISKVVAKTEAFQNLTAPNTHLEVSDCTRVVLESHAFKDSQGTLTVSISRCQYVAIKPHAFSWLLRIVIKEVQTLELSSNAFQFEASQHGRHGPATKIMFKSVGISELPSAVFPSAVAEIRMDDLWTKVIRKDAFCAMKIFSVIISNATIQEIELGAFSDRTLIHSLEFVDVRLGTINKGAFRAGHDNLTIQYSRLAEVETGAIEISVVTVSFNNNEFQKLHERAINLHQWDRIAIDNNLFTEIDADAIRTVIDATATPNFEFSFTGNRIIDAKPGSLKFATVSQRVNTAHVGNNYFHERCNCNIEDWIRKVTGKNSSATWMMDSSYCMVDKFLNNCFKPSAEGYLEIRNYTNIICTEGQSHIGCEKDSVKQEPSVSPPSIGPHIYPRHKGYFDMEFKDPEQLAREKRIIVVICVIAVATILIVIFASGILYMRRNGVCPKLTSGTFMNIVTSWFSPNSSGMTAATSARSISRLSVHEYAGLRPETRILEVETQPEVAEEEEEEFPLYTENKATQTLPEELTEEYLKELRERLNDPDNYSQARDMIEHLYDLIKVEESCNNNNNDSERRTQEENAYDVIRPRVKKPRNCTKATVSIGTKAPSLEKLLPNSPRTRPPITEYTEPRDQRTSDQNHLYAELPGDETVPSTSRLSQPILATLTGRAPQPLPPDVVNDHLINEKKFGGKEDGKTTADAAEVSRSQTRPISFLKALGESIRGATKISSTGNKRPNSLLCEYAEPSDVTAHLYSELPETPSGKMANRPLPTKPDHESMNLARV